MSLSALQWACYINWVVEDQILLSAQKQTQTPVRLSGMPSDWSTPKFQTLGG
eukprot:CAMPEP_0119535478 /NCGR_PEP_ID=MMETSP1344-20130328/48508_1 /TAXON_ID=236787 /ORGANISM="Florenciella parvula, Strain CCMP2471" /LENGTH=51 /DNA_ID=CAMNT_0007577113 /DNA_START=181 /DNA_END=334 /DNA_ORIENTATION=+